MKRRNVTRYDKRNFTYYIRNSSFNCLHYVVNVKITLLERSIWFVIIMTSLITTGFIIYRIQLDIFENPTITSLERRDYPVKNVNFPGVAICNANVISKRRANYIADKISRLTGRPISLVLNYMKLLGGFLDMTIDKNFDMSSAQETLEQYYNDSLRKYTPYLLLSELQIPCEEWMTSCYWRNKNYKCDDLFMLRITYSGFCCTFNYVRRLDKRTSVMNLKDPDPQPHKIEDVGLDNGLIVTLNNNLDDYMLSTAPPAGAKVITFNPEDYPDVTSGSVGENYCSNGFECLLNVQPYAIYSTDAVRSYSVDKRKCSFEDEIKTLYGKYSYSNCIVQCRLYSMLSLCGCVPIYIEAPIQYPVCGFQDIACLNKYKVKWNTLYPFNTDANELAHEREESLVCSNCYYGCSETVYRIGTNFTPLNGTNRTIVRLFFANNYAYLYKQDVKLYWYEILSILGGLVGIMVGCSFVTLMEFFVYVMERFVYAIAERRPNNETNDSLKTNK